MAGRSGEEAQEEPRLYVIRQPMKESVYLENVCGWRAKSRIRFVIMDPQVSGSRW